MNRILEWTIVAVSGGFIAASMFAMTARPLSSLSPISLNFWVLSVAIFACGLLSSLVLVDLKRAFLAAPGIAVFGSLIYVAAVWAPAIAQPEFAAHLFNYALVQSVPVFVVTIVLATLGAVAGTFLNTSIREIDL
jgi:hypothetical protein